MDAGIVALFLFVCILVLLGFCLARVRGLSREIDLLRESVNAQPMPKASAPKVDAGTLTGLLSNPDILKALAGDGDD